MKAAARVKAHFESYEGDNRPFVAVAEWSEEGEGPLVIYWKPCTLGDRAQAFGDEGKADPRAFGKLVFRKALGADGKRLFTEPGDLHMLQYGSDQSIVERVARAILAAPSVADYAKKLQADGMRMNVFVVAERLGKTIEEIEKMSVAAFRETLAFYEVKGRNAP